MSIATRDLSSAGRPNTAFFFRDFLRFLCHDRKRYLVFLTLSIVISFLICMAIPAHYKSTAVVAIMPAPEFTVRQDAGSRDFSSAALAFDQVMKSEIAILASDDLHRQTIEEVGISNLYPDIADVQAPTPINLVMLQIWRFLDQPWRGQAQEPYIATAVHHFGRDLRILPSKDSNVIEISFTSHDPNLAAKGLNRMLGLYAQRRYRVYNDPQLSAIISQASIQAEQTRQLTAALAQFKKDHDISNFSLERDLLLKARDGLNTELSGARVDQAAEITRATKLLSLINSMPKVPVIYGEHDDSAVQNIDASISEVRGRLARTLEHYRPDSYAVRDLEIQLRGRQRERELALLDRHPSALRTGRTVTQDNLEAQRAISLANAEADAARISALIQRIAGLEQELRAKNGIEARLLELERLSAVSKDAFISAEKTLSDQRMTEAEDALRLINVRIVQHASLPYRQDGTRLAIMLCGSLCGLFSTFLFALRRFTQKLSVFETQSLQSLTGLPVLAVFEVN